MIGRVVCLLAVVLAVRGQISQETKDAIDARLTDLETSMATVARQLMLQRLALEESTRTDGDSGVKQIRVHKDGNRLWYTATHVAASTAAIHDHSDLLRTCGMGEFEGVLNGVHFRTRHNDYQVRMPSKTSDAYHAMEDIEFPPVPPEILNQTDMNQAFRDMRSYFRAWQNDDTSTLNYKPYFKPVLCYLEGAWTNDVNLDEPFDSERHHIDAKSWFDLQEKVRFTAYTGDKDQLENFAYLPTAVVNITNGQPVLAQWNYRIVCNPIQDDLLKLSDLKPVDDLHSRMGEKTLEDWLKTRRARFTVTDQNRDRASSRGVLMDKIMAQIPGKDNFMANLTDNNVRRLKYNIYDNNEVLNSGFYHRYVFIKDKDAMGVQVNKRGFADRNLYVAQTSQSRVVPMELNDCDWRGENCWYSFARVSYAIPLEVIWLTPLNSWNPYQLTYRGDHRSDEGKKVTADGRTGGSTADTAFDGVNSKNYFLTPIQFFKGGEIETDAADTVPGSVGVLDPWGNVRSMTASGIRIFLPEILDVGNVRTRYPVFPVYAEGNTGAKDLEALTKIVMDLTENTRFLHTIPEFGTNETEAAIEPDESLTWFKMQTAPSVHPERGPHIHYLDMRTKHALFAMDGCETYQIRTSLSSYHTHLMTVHFNKTSQAWEYLDCDGNAVCRDNHGATLTPIRV